MSGFSYQFAYNPALSGTLNLFCEMISQTQTHLWTRLSLLMGKVLQTNILMQFNDHSKHEDHRIGLDCTE